VTAVFDEKGAVQLLMTIAAINVYNRINVTMRTVLREEPVLPA
jgi:alkylhydroperoxidase family enzyme